MSDSQESTSTAKQLAPEVPQMPPEAIEFAKVVGKLAEQYDLRTIDMDIRIDTGRHSKYKDRALAEQITENMNVHISKRDGRGRPRTQISIQANINLRSEVEWEPDTTD